MVKVNTASMNNIAKLFNPGGNLQKLVDMEYARLADPYVPSDTTALRKSVFIRSLFGMGQLIYEIYGILTGRNTWNDTTSKFQDAPMRGPFWIPRMLNAGGREKIRLAVTKYLEKINGR